MRPWTDLSKIAMPPRIAALSRDQRGYPIPYTVWYDTENKPDFRVIDPSKWKRAAHHRCCGICGEPLGARMAFIGGPSAIEHRLFTDLPAHRDCAVYALQACPFVAAPNFAYARSYPDGTSATQHMDIARPELFGMGITRSYQIARLPDGHQVMIANPFEEIEWWKHGQKAA